MLYITFKKYWRAKQKHLVKSVKGCEADQKYE